MSTAAGATQAPARSKTASFLNFRKERTSITSFTLLSRNTKSAKFPLQQLWILARRLFVIVAAIAYIVTSINACADTFHLLHDTDTPTNDLNTYDSKLLGQYAGKTTIRESPLLAALGFDTTPRAKGLIYLEENATYFDGCVTYDEPSIYQDDFQRLMFASIRDTLAYNLTFLNPSIAELIMPVIDCSLTSLVTDDNTAPRFSYLMRMVNDPDDVYIFTVTMSLQEYQISQQKASGPAAVTTMTFVNDMRATEVKHHFALAVGYPFQAAVFQAYYYYGLNADGFWLLKSVPQNPLIEASKVVSTACPTGYYMSSPNEQASIHYVRWKLHQDPYKMLTAWNWTGKAIVHDTWAWVHYLHLYFVATTVLNLFVLLVVIYYNFRSGKIWIGDAFVAISSTHWLRSVLVILSWYLNHFWALSEFTLFTGNELATTRSTHIYPSIMRADLLSLYVTFVSMIGELLNERIDPALTVALFFLGFETRVDITKWFPGMTKTLIDYANGEFMLGIMPLDPSLPQLSPLQVWNSHPLPKAHASVVLSALFPVFSTLVFLPMYVAVRKIYRRVRPDVLSSQRSSANSGKESANLRSNLTQFEFATGVALRERFGVVSDYDNYVYIKGMKFASADGIYTSGFVIANGKFLIATDDLYFILLIKLTRIRFQNIYVYEIDGNSVKKTARLVYPETISFADIVHLNLRTLLYVGERKRSEKVIHLESTSVVKLFSLTESTALFILLTQSKVTLDCIIHSVQ